MIHHNTQSDYEFHTALCPVAPSFGGNTLRNLNPITEYMATVLKLLICVVDIPGSNLIRETHYRFLCFLQSVQSFTGLVY
jgi:hypothetical protein